MNLTAMGRFSRSLMFSGLQSMQQASSDLVLHSSTSSQVSLLVEINIATVVRVCSLIPDLFTLQAVTG